MRSVSRSIKQRYVNGYGCAMQHEKLFFWKFVVWLLTKFAVANVHFEPFTWLVTNASHTQWHKAWCTPRCDHMAIASLDWYGASWKLITMVFIIQTNPDVWLLFCAILSFFPTKMKMNGKTNKKEWKNVYWPTKAEKNNDQSFMKFQSLSGF